MKKTDPAPPPPRTAWRRYALVGAVLVVVVAVGLVLYWPRLRIAMDINTLQSDVEADRRAAQDRLRRADRDLAVEMMEAKLNDDDATFLVRERVADLLIERNRLPLVEKTAREGSLDARAATLSVLGRQPHFRDEIVPDPAYRVKETVREWIRARRDGLERAVQLAFLVDAKEALEDVRPLLRRASLEGVPPAVHNYVLVAALHALSSFGDCESVPTILDLARSDPEYLVRQSALDVLKSMTWREDAPCRDSVTPDAVRDSLAAALRDPDGRVRIKALTLLVQDRDSPWIPPVRDLLAGIVDSDASDSERRWAVMALAAAKDPALRDRLPRLAHDPGREVRTATASAVIQYEPPNSPVLVLHGLLVGLIGRETENETAYDVARDELVDVAGQRFVGWPETVQAEWMELNARAENTRRREDREASARFVKQFFFDLFHKGEARGVSRDSWARAWFVWFAERAGLPPEAAEKAAQVRDAFWAAAARGDAAGADAALRAAPPSPADVFLYERGWLERRGRAP